MRRGVAEDVGHLAHLDHERALPGGEIVGRADAREHAVDHADDGALGRDERAHLRHEHDERSLAHIRGFTGHVRPGHDGDAVVRVVEERVVRDKETVLLRLLDNGVTPLADIEHAREIDLGADVVVFHRRLRQRAQRVEPGHGVRRRLHARDLARDELAHLVEERVLQLRDALAVDAQQLRVLFTVSRGELMRDGRIVGKAEVDDPLPPVTLQGFQMIGGGVALGLAVLRHDIADVKLLRVRRADRVGHAVDEQVRDHARIKASRAEQDEVGLRNSTEGGGQGLGLGRDQIHMVDAAVLLLFRVENVRFAHDARAVFKHGLELYIRVRHRQHAARDRQYLSHHGDGLFKAPRHAVERRKQQVSERLPLKLPLGKAIAEKLLHHRLGVRERLHTLPHVTRRQNTHFTAQHAAPAAVVRHRDDGR